MFLEGRQQQIDFLQECYAHIQRIDAECVKKEKASNLHIKNKLTPDLPLTIKISTDITDITRAKLLVLSSIYNRVASIKENEAKKINLEDTYYDVKKNIDPLLKTKNLPDCNKLMSSHRNEFMRSGFLAWILSFFWKPRSANYLGKTGFFAANQEVGTLQQDKPSTQPVPSKPGFFAANQDADKLTRRYNFIAQLVPMFFNLYLPAFKSSKYTLSITDTCPFISDDYPYAVSITFHNTSEDMKQIIKTACTNAALMSGNYSLLSQGNNLILHIASGSFEYLLRQKGVSPELLLPIQTYSF